MPNYVLMIFADTGCFSDTVLGAMGRDPLPASEALAQAKGSLFVQLF